MSKWSIVYQGAYNDDGSPYFPEKLSAEKLQELRQTMGVYIFTNQYLNQVIPSEDQDFKRAWIQTYKTLPANRFTFAFVDPAISLNDGADYTATVVVHFDEDKRAYVEHASRQRLTATETVRWIWKIYQEFKPMIIGIEDVAYQKALLHILAEDMIQTGRTIPIKGLKRSRIANDGSKRTSNDKHFRIRGLVPRFEFNKLFLNEGLDDLVMELLAFPRGKHDDLPDALASVFEIGIFPTKKVEVLNVSRDPNDPGYEKWYINKLQKEARSQAQDND